MTTKSRKRFEPESGNNKQLMFIKLQPGQRCAHTASVGYRLTMASLQPEDKKLPHCACNTINEAKTKQPDNDKVMVIVEHDLKEHLMCVLDGNRVKQCKLDLVVRPGQQIAFKTIGKIPAQLTGVTTEV